MKQLKIYLYLILCLFCGAITESKAAKTDKNQPNIIYIMVDDAGYGDFWLLRAKAIYHAKHRPHGYRGNAFHSALLWQYSVRANPAVAL